MCKECSEFQVPTNVSPMVVDDIMNADTSYQQPLAERKQIYHLDNEWTAFRERLQNNFYHVSHNNCKKLFFGTWNAERTPFDTMLLCIPEEDRHVFICNSCRQFLNRYGTLCVINPDGTLKSALFNYEENDEEKLGCFAEFSKRMIAILENESAMVSRIYLKNSKKHDLGNASIDEEMGYSHLCIPHAEVLFKSFITSYEEAFMIRKTFIEHSLKYSVDVLERTILLINGDYLPRGKKYEHAVQYMLDYKKAVQDVPKAIHHNLTWKYSMNAADGVWNIANTAIGEFMTNLESGNDLDTCIQMYKKIVDPRYYMRPQNIEVTSSQTDRAYEIMKILNIRSSSFARRFANWDEVKDRAIWIAPDAEPSSDSENIFSHLSSDSTKKKTSSNHVTMVRKKSISWLIDELKSGRVKSMRATSNGNIHIKDAYALTAPMHEDNDPIFYYDKEDNRNPYGWFTNNGGLWSAPSPHNIIGVVESPNVWNPDVYNRQGFTVYIFVVDGIRPTFEVSGCLFPELMRDEFREVRSTIEAYSKSQKLYIPPYSPGGQNIQLAAGLGFATNGFDDVMYITLVYKDIEVDYEIYE